ncbi:MFS transporter (plasmid) [Sphingobium sp. SJ10-10]|uniref:MFS transporter n=1 Tax=Sphingobium sp. SJ10-10 TaxID=3114999 RepID=UPI002E16BD87|nr:MFS transporter [Sphingobium sp. SJ10-10]
MVRINPSEWRLGRGCLAAAVLGYGAGFGSFVFSSSQFIDPMRQEFGWTAGEAAFLPISLLVLAFLYPVTGRFTNAYGPRLLSVSGLIGFVICFVLLATLPLTVPRLRLIALCLGVSSAAAGTVPFGRAVVSWFRDNPGFALGISGSGATLGGVVGIPLTSYLIAHYGWRAAYLGIAAIITVVAIPVVWSFLALNPTGARGVSSADESAGPKKEDKGARWWADARFWLLSATVIFSGFAIGIYLNHLSPILIRLGFDIQTASVLGSIFAFTTFFGRMCIGFLLDRGFPQIVAASCLLMATMGAVIITHFAAGYVIITGLSVVLIALAYGAEADLAAFFALRFFGEARFSATFSILATFIALAIAAGGVLSSRIVDLYGTYHMAMNAAALAFALATIAMTMMGLLIARRSCG